MSKIGVRFDGQVLHAIANGTRAASKRPASRSSSERSPHSACCTRTTAPHFAIQSSTGGRAAPLKFLATACLLPNLHRSFRFLGVVESLRVPGRADCHLQHLG